MKLSKFLKDKLFVIITFLSIYFILLLMFFAFKIPNSLIIATSLLLFLFLCLILLWEYIKKRTFYTNMLNNINILDKAYLVLETLEKPSFYDGELLYLALYEINKSFNEDIKNLELQNNDFKEYIEMWIHEVKVPISTLVLMAHNHQDKFDKKTLEQLRILDNYVEQVLYYSRSENAFKDYLIKEISLNKVINNVALKNKDDLLENRISLIVENVKLKIFTDSKWLEFILNQIINNSIKYHKENIDSFIKIYAKDDKNKITLILEDNGIGIKETDLPRVFDKSFTGSNGRIKSKSTGMGLYIAKNLCDKLGHSIKIESKYNEYTKVLITFAKNDFYANITKL